MRAAPRPLRRRIRTVRAALGALVAGAWCVWLGGAGCAGADEMDITTACADFATFRPVSSVIEARCGTLDCHGSIARPMRIYGRNGLRKPIDFGATDEASQVLIAEITADQGIAEYYAGGLQGTTNGELADNYRAVCGLEPEIMNQVRLGQESPDALTMMRKARLVEKHKGGKIFIPAQSPGDECLVQWLTSPSGEASTFLPTKCVEELQGF